MYRFRRFPYKSVASALLFLLPLTFGCGTGATAPVLSLSITQQPTSKTVPLGKTATFSVQATGRQPLEYQWMRNGNTISGATTTSYTTGILSVADANDMFQVVVSDSSGQLNSNVAILTLGPRSPLEGDLRFQQVAAQSTVNGYAGSLGTNFSGSQSDQFTNATGAPMSVGPGCSGGHGPGSCYWLAQVNALPSGVSGLSVAYGYGGHYSELASGIAQLQDSQTVITGLNINQANDAFAVSFMKAAAGGNFDVALHTVAATDLQAAISTEGQKSRVVTAISWDAGLITFASYGWTGDTTTTYDSEVLPANYSNVDSVAKQLATEGYIITACGGDASTTSLWLVGTKVTGDTLTRPILVTGVGVSPQPLFSGGYAIVGLFSQFGTPTWWVGER